MTGFKKDPLRPTSSEERFDENEQERLDMHDEYLRRVDAAGMNVGVSNLGNAPARIGTESTPASQPNLPNATTDLELAQQVAKTRVEQHSASGRAVEPRVNYAYVRSDELQSYATNMPGQYNVPTPITTPWTPDVAPAPTGMDIMYKGMAIDPATGQPVGTGGSIGPQVEPPSRIPPDQALADRLSSLGGPASPVRGTAGTTPGSSLPSWSSTADRIAMGISTGAGMPQRTELLGAAQGAKLAGGGYQISHYAQEGTGEITVGRERIRDIQSTLASGMHSAMQQYGGMDPKEAVANVQRSLGNVAKSYIDAMSAEEKKLAGGSPEAELTGRQAVKRVQSLVNKMTYAAVTNLEKSQGVQGAAEAGRSAVAVSAGDFERISSGQLGSSQQEALQAAVSAAGGSRAVARGGLTWAGAGGGMLQTAGTGPSGGSPWTPGGDLGAAGGGSRGARGGLWEGQLGGVMYGAYIAKRFWTYTGAPVMKAMDEYATMQGAAIPMLTGEIPSEGPGALQASRARGQYALGEGAYNIFGGVAGLSAEVLQNEPVATAAAGAGIFGGIALGAQILGKTGVGAGITGAGALAGAAPWLGIAGIGLTGVSVAQSIYRGQGKELGFVDTLRQTAQTIDREAAIVGMSVGYGVSSLLGKGDVYAERLGEFMEESKLGQSLTTEYGIQTPGGDLASQDELQEAAQRMRISESEVSALLPGAYAVTGQRGTGGVNEGVLDTINNMMLEQGMSLSGAVSSAGGYAGALGYLPGQQGYTEAFNQYGAMGVAEQAREMRDAQSRAGKAGQWRQIMSRAEISDPRLVEEMDLFRTQQRGQIAFGGAAQLTRAGMGGVQAMRIGQSQAMRVDAGDITEFQMQQGASMMGSAAPYFSPAALRAYGGGATEAFSNLSAGQASLVGGMMGGNVGAMSFGANIGMGPGYNALTNIAGQSMYQVNMQQGMLNMAGFGQNMAETSMAGGAISNLPGYQRFQAFSQAYAASMPTTHDAALQWQSSGQGMRAGMDAFGMGADMQEFFGQNPEAGLQDYQLMHSNRMHGLQMAGIGVGMQRIQMQRQFMYGGGDWQQPTSDSLWGIQDRMRSLQWQGQQAGAAFSLERMDVGNQFGVRQEDLSSRRMGMQQDYQRWGTGFQRAGMDLSRQFTMENRQFQDQLRGMSTAFTMEDFDENIRMSSGRERRQLVTQRERFVSMTNVQDEQTDRNREQQEEMWAREDEQFEKKREYMEQTIALDEEQFNMNVERRETLFEMDRGDLERRIELAEELHKLQDEQLEKQREYSVAQMDLAEKALGIQAAAAVAQKAYSDSMTDFMKPVEEFDGMVKNVTANDELFNILKGFEAAATALGEMDPESANALRELAETVGGLNPDGISALNRQLQLLMATSGYGP